VWLVASLTYLALGHLIPASKVDAESARSRNCPPTLRRYILQRRREWRQAVVAVSASLTVVSLWLRFIA